MSDKMAAQDHEQQFVFWKLRGKADLVARSLR